MLGRLLGRSAVAYVLYGIIVATMSGDVVLLGALGGASVVAEFVLVWRVPEALIQVLWRIPEYFQPYVIQMDVQGDHAGLREATRRISRTLLAAAAGIGAAYAVAGQFAVRLWVGSENVPKERWVFALAGGAIFWLAIARLPAVVAFARIRLSSLLKVSGAEVIGKVGLILVTYPFWGYAAPLISVNIVHVAGIAIGYRLLLSRS